MKQPWTSTLSSLAAVFIYGSCLPAFEARAEPTVTLAVNDAAIAEAAGVATFTATLSETSLLDVTVNLALSGTATGSGIDYTLSSAAIVITAGNLINTAGGGSYGHIDSPAAGAISLRQAYQCWLAGADPIEWAKDHREFARAFESFPLDADALYPGWRDHLGVAAA